MTPVELYRKLEGRVQNSFFDYIDRKHPPATSHRLNRNRLYIFLTARGWLLFAVNFVLWMLGTNYQNNLILALSFLLAALFIVTILHTYANLSRLSVSSKGAGTAFAGNIVEFYFQLKTKRESAENLVLSFKNDSHYVKEIHVQNSEKLLVKVPVEAPRRGWLTPGRLLLESEYPLGLLRCWSWLVFDVQALIFPEPSPVDEPRSLAADEEGADEKPIAGGEDYSGLQQYRIGDPLKHVAWKAYARGQGLYTKEFSQNISREIWLDYKSVPGAGVEEKLSGLCFWALEYEKRDINYGLKLPGVTISPGKGEDHQYQVLRELACYDLN